MGACRFPVFQWVAEQVGLAWKGNADSESCQKWFLAQHFMHLLICCLSLLLWKTNSRSGAQGAFIFSPLTFTQLPFLILVQVFLCLLSIAFLFDWQKMLQDVSGRVCKAILTHHIHVFAEHWNKAHLCFVLLFDLGKEARTWSVSTSFLKPKRPIWGNSLLYSIN